MAKIQAMDVAGNTLEGVLEIDIEISDRDSFKCRLNGGQLNRQVAMNVWLVRYRISTAPLPSDWKGVLSVR